MLIQPNCRRNLHFNFKSHSVKNVCASLKAAWRVYINTFCGSFVSFRSYVGVEFQSGSMFLNFDHRPAVVHKLIWTHTYLFLCFQLRSVHPNPKVEHKPLLIRTRARTKLLPFFYSYNTETASMTQRKAETSGSWLNWIRVIHIVSVKTSPRVSVVD